MREREELYPYERLRVVRAKLEPPLERLDGLRCEAGEQTSQAQLKVT